MQQPPFEPPQQPFQPPYQQPYPPNDQPTQAYFTQPYPTQPVPGQFQPSPPGSVPPTQPPRKKRRTGCIIAGSIAGGLLFLLTLCIIIVSFLPDPPASPSPTPQAQATPTKAATQNAQAQATMPATPTIAPTPTQVASVPTPTPTPLPPTPTPIPTPTPRPGPSRAQVDELARTLYSLQPKVKSYDEKTGTLVLEMFSGSAIVVNQKFVKDNIQEVHEHFWQSKLYFASITVESYHNRKDGPPVKLAYSVMKWATASTIDWGALFGVGDLWEKYDEKWMSTKQEDFDGQGL